MESARWEERNGGGAGERGQAGAEARTSVNHAAAMTAGQEVLTVSPQGAEGPSLPSAAAPSKQGARGLAADWLLGCLQGSRGAGLGVY